MKDKKPKKKVIVCRDCKGCGRRPGNLPCKRCRGTGRAPLRRDMDD